MSHLINFFSSTWAWTMKHSVGFIVGGIVLIYMLANSAAIEAKSKTEQEAWECKSTCFPQQHEYIAGPTNDACWCYLDQNTMKKADK